MVVTDPWKPVESSVERVTLREAVTLGVDYSDLRGKLRRNVPD